MKLLKGVENDVLVDDLVADLRILNNFCGEVRFISLDDIPSRSIEIICSDYKFFGTCILERFLSFTVGYRISSSNLLKSFYRGVTHQSDTFGYELTHIRVKRDVSYLPNIHSYVCKFVTRCFSLLCVTF